jgi:dimethylsulfoniopropionate demethylase
VLADGRKVGRISSAAWSPDFGTNVAIGMIRVTHWEPGTDLVVETPDGVRTATVQPHFWN